MATVPMVTKALKTKTASDPDVLSLQCLTSISQVLPLSPMSIVLWRRGSQERAGSAELSTDFLAVALWGRVAVTAFLFHTGLGGTDSACAFSLTGV